VFALAESDKVSEKIGLPFDLSAALPAEASCVGWVALAKEEADLQRKRV